MCFDSYTCGFDRTHFMHPEEYQFSQVQLVKQTSRVGGLISVHVHVTIKTYLDVNIIYHKHLIL